MRETNGLQAPETIDDVIAELRELRRLRGEPSFAEIARRVTEQRTADGASEAAARTARTTIYDAFRPGRVRMDAELLRQIARALGEPSETAAQWAARARAAAPSRPRSVGSGSSSAPPPTSTDSPALHRLQRLRLQKPRKLQALGLLIACLLLNIVGYSAAAHFPVPLYLDMAGTAVAAMILGPWWGLAAATLTHPLGMLTFPQGVMALLPVNMIGALAWGFGARSSRLTSSITRFFLFNIGVAILCSVISVGISLHILHGGTGHQSDDLYRALQGLGLPLDGSMLIANLTTSVPGKLIAGFIALMVGDQLGRRGWGARATTPSGADSASAPAERQPL